jgi:glycosyltransferase involved in cell wall biosynthesis
MRVVTNFERFEPQWDGGSSQYAQTFPEFRRLLHCADIALVNGDIDLILKLCAWFLIAPWQRKPIVAVDVVLRKPRTSKARIIARAKAVLLRRVDHFIHYFRDLDGYAREYGITSARSSYVAFKPNVRYRYQPGPDQPAGEYVLCLGRSQRDYDTFFDAMDLLPYPAAIPKPDFADLETHASRFTRTLDRLPPNVRVFDDDGSQQALIRAIEGAKLVVLPILRATLAASGISVYLNAMLLGRAVVISAGPGVSDLLTDQAVIVPPEDPRALADAIRRVWEDDALRARVAETGRQYALSLGGEPELRRRIIQAVEEWLKREPRRLQ